MGAEVDSKFEFVLEVLDYLEALMKVQNAVFRTMDKSRNSTQTASGHCRLSACIPIILDSQEWYYFFYIRYIRWYHKINRNQELYSLCAKFLSILHTELPSEPLSGFRDRFLQIYKEMKIFFAQCANITYIRQLVRVPGKRFIIF